MLMCSLENIHASVLLDEILGAARSKNVQSILDCTLGLGGHAEALLEQCKTAQLTGVDQDEVALSLAKTRLANYSSRLTLLQVNFRDLATVIDESARFDFILADLGVSSLQLDTAERGFSFQQAAPLDMRMSQATTKTAAAVLNDYSEMDLKRVFVRGGQTRYAKRLASECVHARPLETTAEFAALCERVLPSYSKTSGRKRSHPATVPFQAVRIEVNDELRSLQAFLADIPQFIAPGGLLAIISFHSLEDKYVTRSMRAWSKIEPLEREQGKEPFGTLLTKKAIEATQAERMRNPRSRSARLRIFERGAGT